MHWPAFYEIQVEGGLQEHWTAWFGGLHIATAGTDTIISGLITDQSALHGVLTKISDLGMCLIAVRRISPGQARNTTPE